MLRKLNFSDKAQLIELLNSVGMFAADEIAYICQTFDNATSNALWFGCFEEQQMTGVAYCMPMEMTHGTWNVLMLLVKPAYQKQGIGKSLMQLMEHTLIAQAQRLLLVETSSTEHFTGARAFYHAIGYTEQGLIAHYYAKDDHKITFTKLL